MQSFDEIEAKTEVSRSVASLANVIQTTDSLAVADKIVQSLLKLVKQAQMKHDEIVLSGRDARRKINRREKQNVESV